jgi:hypothetical protein
MAQLITLTSTLIAFSSAVITVWLTSRLARRTAEFERIRNQEEGARRYREPLLRAAFNLQSRLYNIVQQRFLETFLIAGQPSEQEYAIENTLFLVGQYFGWTEIIRREVQFLAPGDVRQEESAVSHVEHIAEVFSGTNEIREPILRVFRGEQRALGEMMLTRHEPATPSGPVWDCIGYAAFVKRGDDVEMKHWFGRLRDNLEVLATHPGEHHERVIRVQRALIDLIEVLDPESSRVPKQLMSRLSES